MADALTDSEKRILLAVLDTGLAAEMLASSHGAEAVDVADGLVRRALVYRSGRGVYKVTAKSRQRALTLLGEDAPQVPVLELLHSARRPLGQFWFFNGVGDV